MTQQQMRFISVRHIVAASISIAVVCISTQAGTPTIEPPIRIDTGGAGAANETTISAARAQTGHIAAAWNDSRFGSTRIGVAISVDGGRTWTDSLLRPPARHGTDREGDPMTAYDPVTGDLWVGGIAFNSDLGGVFVARKSADRTSFDPPTMAYVGSGADKGLMAVGPDPDDASRSRLYVAFNRGLIFSTDAGRSWSDPKPIGMGVGFIPRVGPGGELYIAYWDGVYGIRLRRSFDGGETLGPPIRIAERLDTWPTNNGSRLPGSFRAPPTAYLAVNPVSGALYCIYFDTTAYDGTNFDVDLYLTRSSDRGTTWSPPRIVSATGYSPGDQFFPWIEVDGAGRLHLVFFDTRNTAQTDAKLGAHAMIDAYYAVSEDGGETWREYRLTPRSFSSANDATAGGTQFIGDYIGLTVTGSVAIPCYPSAISGDPDVFIHRITYPHGDRDNDGDTDSDDVRAFIGCSGGRIGPDGQRLPDDCGVFDNDQDDDLDLSDYSAMQRAFTGDCGVAILRQPRPYIACIGENVVLDVVADDNAVAYRWHHNSVDLANGIGPVLELNSVQPASAGDYYVTVIGRCGTVQSQSAKLTVLNCGDAP